MTNVTAVFCMSVHPSVRQLHFCTGGDSQVPVALSTSKLNKTKNSVIPRGKMPKK